MTTAAKGGFPGCAKRKVDKRKVKNVNCFVRGRRWENTLNISEQLKKNLHRFYEIFGDSDEDDEFHGFSSEECGLRAYKRIGGNGNSSVEMQIPDILCSPIDLTKKKVTTRLAHARNSLESLPSSQRTRRRKQTIIRKRYSKSKIPIVDGKDVPAEPLVRVASPESNSRGSPDHGFTKYKHSSLDFHKLSKGVGHLSSNVLNHPTVRPNKTSPIKPATFIAPSLSQQPHHVTNVTPTCLKIKINMKDLDETGPGHPKVLAKALLARASKKVRKGKNWEMDPPVHTSTPINSHPTSKTKSKLFVMPTKSSRSSRIIKVNRRYIDDYSKNASEEPAVPVTSSSTVSNHQNSFSEQVTKPAEPSPESPSKGRPLLKEATFRVAALANINNKPLPSRPVEKEKGLSTRMRARKLIKRARFKHPTSSSTLVVGNDFEDETDKKKNLIREATFKAPDQGSQKSSSRNEKDSLPDLGLTKQQWERLLKSDCKSVDDVPNWTKQEIHNVLHGANTFSTSWVSVARHYEYHPMHRDWNSVRCRARILRLLGLLSDTLKVKSSILLQLRPRYSDNPNVTVFTPYELKVRGLERNHECTVGEGGRMIKSNDKRSLTHDGSALKRHHQRVYESWKRMSHSSEADFADPSSIYLGFSKSVFSRMCQPKRKDSKVKTWTAREIHNLLHGIHMFGVGEWNRIHEMYQFHPTHDNLGIRARFKSVCCRGLVVAGKVKTEILPLLQPKFSPKGKKYFEHDKRRSREQDKIKLSKKRSVKENHDIPNIEDEVKASNAPKSSSDSDMTSPPRKQAYHLFGTAPVWDESAAAPSLQSLESSSVIEESMVPEPIEKTPEASCRNGTRLSAETQRERKTSSDRQGLKKPRKQDKNDSAEVKSKSSGPRIKHVCRRASLVTGQKIATYEDGKNPRLSALPKEEREKIASEVERLRGLHSDTSLSSDSELEVPVPRKQQQGAGKKTKPNPTFHVKKRPSDVNMREGKRCNSCKSCKFPKCGDCDNCRNPANANDNQCARRPSCLNPVVNGSNPDRRSANAMSTKTNAIQNGQSSATNGKIPDTMSQRYLQTASTGVLLSPDSRYQIRKQLHEKDLRLPSIIKIDEWKERYEIEDLLKMGGVSLITSTTPSTQFLCSLCGSVGKSRPARRISSNSDSSVCTDRSDSFSVSPLFIFCSSCCEPFHPFCLEDHEQHVAITAAKKGVWICRRCRFCNVCGRPGNLLECRRCNKTYHSSCLGPSYPTKPSKNQVWVCMRCVRCRSCGASRPGLRPGSRWTHDFQLCQRCGDLFDKGNFCPICRRCYRDEDYDSRMVQCGTCKRWVHSRCESLTVEMYTLLSHLPDDVQYVCPDCDGRRSKVEGNLNHSDSLLTDDSGNDSIEGDKMRCLLSKLPSPSWRKMIEEEIQSGIERVTMALFHNKEAACILKKSSFQEGDRPSDLFTVRFAVHNRRYTSVSEFSSDVCAILDTVTPDSMESEFPQETDAMDKRGKRKKKTTGARRAFCQEMHNVFPWFDVDTGRVRDSSDVPEDLLPNATLPPHTDHIYAQWQDRDIDVTPGGPDTPMKNFGGETPSKTDDIGLVMWDSMTPKNYYDDMRQCLFCGKYGDDSATNAGRLLYCGQDEWVHVNCALWSAEVFERHDGSLQNVHSAVSRGRMMKCEYCKLPGATVGCNTRDCPQNYHFACARADSCCFQDDKKVFCARHSRHVHRELVHNDGFEVARRVVVDNDEMRPNKRWQRGVYSHDVTVLMGSATVHQLGQLAMASDSRDYLIPVHYRMTRIFWSTTHAGRRVRYTITVTEQKPSVDSDTSLAGFGSPGEGKLDSLRNHTISHADDDKPVFTSPPKKSHYPAADSCRAKLTDRFGPFATPIPATRRKSYDHCVGGQQISRPRRLSGSTYTIIGSINRTLPQAITPLPSVSQSHQARNPPPVLSAALNNTGMISESDKATPTTSKCSDDSESIGNKNNTNEIDPGATSKGQDTALQGDLHISPDNPFLNFEQTMCPISKSSDPCGMAFSTTKDSLAKSPPLNVRVNNAQVPRHMASFLPCYSVTTSSTSLAQAHIMSDSGPSVKTGTSGALSGQILPHTLAPSVSINNHPKISEFMSNEGLDVPDSVSPPRTDLSVSSGQSVIPPPDHPLPTEGLDFPDSVVLPRIESPVSSGQPVITSNQTTNLSEMSTLVQTGENSEIPPNPTTAAELNAKLPFEISPPAIIPTISNLPSNVTDSVTKSPPTALCSSHSHLLEDHDQKDLSSNDQSAATSQQTDNESIRVLALSKVNADAGESTPTNIPETNNAAVTSNETENEVSHVKMKGSQQTTEEEHKNVKVSNDVAVDKPDRETEPEVTGDVTSKQPGSQVQESHATVDDCSSVKSQSVPSTGISLLKEAREAEMRESCLDERSSSWKESLESASMWWSKDIKKKGDCNALKSVPASKLLFQKNRFKKRVRKDSSSEDIDYFPSLGVDPIWRGSKTSAQFGDDNTTTLRMETRRTRKIEVKQNALDSSEDSTCNGENAESSCIQLRTQGKDEEDSTEESPSSDSLKTRSKMSDEENVDLEDSSKVSEEAKESNTTPQSSSPAEVNETENKSEKANSENSSYNTSTSNSASTTDDSFSKEQPLSTRKRKRGRHACKSQIKCLREFARPSSESENDPRKDKVAHCKLVNGTNEHLETSDKVLTNDCRSSTPSEDSDSPEIKRKKTRSMSHDFTDVQRKQQVPAHTTSDTSPENIRKRSKSVEAGHKKKQKSSSLVRLKNELELLEADFSPRRYPRRNTLTCLKSFSGLSPQYAIQSYTAINNARRERAAARSFKSARSSSTRTKQKNVLKGKAVKTETIKSETSENEMSKPDANESDRGGKTEKLVVENEKSNEKTHSSENENVAEKCESNPASPSLAPDLLDKVVPCSIILSDCDPPENVSEMSEKETSSDKPDDKTDCKGIDEEKKNLVSTEIPVEDSNKETCGLKKDCSTGDEDTSQETSEKETNVPNSKECTADVIEKKDQLITDSEPVRESLFQENDTTPNQETPEAVVVLQKIPVSPSLPGDSFNESLEIMRGVGDEGTQPLENSIGRRMENILPTPEKVQDTLRVTSLPNSLPLTPTDGAMITSPSAVGYGFPTDDHVSPLSPRDEPKLPLPMESDTETAAFMVTSECPVLNADEVQSLLAMPPANATCPTEVQSPLVNLANMYQQCQQQSLSPLPVTMPVSSPTQVTYAMTPMGNVTFVPINYAPQTPQMPVVIYNQPIAQTYIQPAPTVGAVAVTQHPSGNLPYALRVTTSNGKLSRPVIVSPPGQLPPKGYRTAQILPHGVSFPYQNPIVVPLSHPEPKFRSAPTTPAAKKRTHNVKSPTFMPRNVVTPYSVPPSPQSGCSVRINTPNYPHPPPQLKAPPQHEVSQKTNVSAHAHVQNVTAPKHDKNDLKLASDQKLVLDEMIEFYSNKNNLSSEEKEMVRAIIAQQIQNKCLPMPTINNQEGQNSFTHAVHSASALQESQSASSMQCNVRQTGSTTYQADLSRPSILQGQKRPHPHSSEDLIHEVPSKRAKKVKRKEKHLVRSFEDNSPENEWPPQELDNFSSPLLNFYLGAAQAEHTTSEKLARKWREALRMLNRYNVHMDVPWSWKRGQKDNKENRLPPPPPQSSRRPHLVFEISSEDGYYAKGTDLQELISSLLDAVQDCRSNARLPSGTLCLSSVLTPHAFLGVSHDAVRFLVEQLPGARHCPRYRAKYHKHREMPEEVVTHINPHGCARAEKYQGRSKPDMFSFLASKHRVPPSYNPTRTQNVDMQQNSTRRATSMDLPMAMRFRHLRTFAREAVGVYRSAIHGRGLYCKRDIEAGEMVMEYTGEVIRCALTDHREKMYEKKGIGCYMFRMDDMYVVDATMMGSGARFINHSCDPCCYSRIVHIDGKKHIIIFALRKIYRGEELTYDYKFPIESEDQKIMCNCGAKTCRKYMN